MPAVSWPTTYYPLHQYGLRQVFVDVDLDTLNYDLDALAAAVTDRTRAVMTVNLLGNPNDFDRLQAFCDERGLILIEDNCESLGATFTAARPARSARWARTARSSPTTSPRWRVAYISTDDDELHHLLLALRAHGWTRDLPEENLIGGRKNPDPFMESFHFFLPGYNVRPIEMEAALAQVQVSRLPEFIEGRRRNARTFLEIVRQYPQLRPQSETGESSWFGFSMIVDPGAGVDRKTVLDALSALPAWSAGRSWPATSPASRCSSTWTTASPGT